MAHDKDAVRKILAIAKKEGRNALTAPEGKLVCDAYGISVPGRRRQVAHGRGGTGQQDGIPGGAQDRVAGHPAQDRSRWCAGGVNSAADVERGYLTIVENAKKYNANAQIVGVQVQQMIGGGQEVIIGAVTDPSFGKLVAFGLGGVLVEVLKDVTFRMAPATYDDALSMLDGIAAADVLKGVRGADPANREALAGMIQRVSELVSDFPEISELDLNPVFASKDGAIAADVRIVIDDSPQPEKYRPSQEEIVRQMNRIMRPDTVAVIGASAEDGKIGNSVMKNLINGGYQGKIYPIHPKADEIMGMTAYKSVLDVPGDVDVAVFAIPAKFVAQALEEVGKKGIPGAVLIPSGFAETGNVEGQEEIVAIARKHNIRLMGPNIYGFYYTPKPVRDVLHPTTSRARPRCRRSRAASAWRSSASRARRRWACPRSSGSATSPTSTRTICSRSSSRTTTPRSSPSIART
jgi:predicted CoA-binding protein